MAVYTEVSDEELRDFLRRYDLGEVQAFKGIAEGVENSNYLVQTDQANFILTLYEKRVSRTDLPYFIGLMGHLADKGIPCPTPIHDRDGAVLQELNGRPACITSFLQGLWPRRIHAEHCTELGAALARLHLAGQDFPMTRPNNLSVEGWRPLYAQSCDRAHEVRPGLCAELEGELDAMESFWPGDLPAGVIHADLFPDNVFFKDGKLSGLIDFYFACNDLFAYDLAICLNAWCFEPDGSFNITKARYLLQSYQKVRPLTQSELESLPLLARGSALRFLLTRLYDWLNCPPGALVKPKDPLEYLDKLRFHRAVKGPGEYGLAA